MGFGEHFLLMWTNDVLAHAINIAFFFFIKSPGLSVHIAMGKWVSLSPVVMGPSREDRWKRHLLHGLSGGRSCPVQQELQKPLTTMFV